MLIFSNFLRRTFVTIYNIDSINIGLLISVQSNEAICCTSICGQSFKEIHYRPMQPQQINERQKSLIHPAMITSL